MPENIRCSICNKVSNEIIQTNPGEFTKKSFVPDLSNKLHYVCMDCNDVIQETINYYHIDDDIWGWNK